MKKFLPVIAMIVLLLIGYVFYQKHDESEYVKNSRSLVSEINQVSALSEAVNRFYYSIWRNAIYKEDSFKNLGKYHYKEFNEALLIAKEEMKSSVDTIDAYSKRIEVKMKLLNNPPAKYEGIHTNILRLFGLFNEYSGLARSPQGSLMTFGTKSTELSTEIIKVSKEIEVLLPSE